MRSICEMVMTDAMYDVPSDKSIEHLVIDVAYIEEKLSRSKIQKLKAA